MASLVVSGSFCQFEWYSLADCMDIQELSCENRDDGGQYHLGHSEDTEGHITFEHTNPDVKALISTATKMAGSTDCSSLALAALQTNDPQDSLILLAACSTKTSIDVQRSHDTAVSALVKAQMAEEGNTNSDYTYEIRWKQQREENEKLKERLDRIESVLKQLVGMVVQTRGTEDDQVRTNSLIQTHAISYLSCHIGFKYDEELGSLVS